MTSVPLDAGGRVTPAAGPAEVDRGSVRTRRGLRVLAVAASVATYLLIVAGGVVRVSGSGLGCGVRGQDWPLCHGRLVPPADIATVIEFSHRMMATLSTVLIVSLAVVAWTRYRHIRRIALPAAAVVGLLVVQILLGALTVELRLPGDVVLVHLANALLLLAVLLYAVVQCFITRPAVATAPDPARMAAAKPLLWAAGATFLLILSGALVVAHGAGFACAGWPLCGNGIQLPEGTLATYNVFHRVVAGLVGVGLLLAVHGVLRVNRGVRPVRIAAWCVGVLLLAQVAAGAILVEMRLRSATRGVHLALASLLWAATVVLTLLVRARVWAGASAEERELGGAPVLGEQAVEVGGAP